VKDERIEVRGNDANKKKWSTPKLRVFVRTRRDERVLANCKQRASGVGPNATDNACTGNYTCRYCYDWGS
jgi:hypothetical protein